MYFVAFDSRDVDCGALSGDGLVRTGVRAWLEAGLPTEKGFEGCLVSRNDVVLSPSIRGTKEDMQRYLEWELKLGR